MSEVTNAMEASYCSDDKNDDRCVYWTTHEEKDTQGTSREAKKETPIKFQLVFEETTQRTGRTTSVPQVITNTQEIVPAYTENAKQTASDRMEGEEKEESDHIERKKEAKLDRNQR